METPGGTQSYVKEGTDDLNSKNDRSRDADEREGEDKRKQRLSKSRKPGNGEDGEGSDGSGRKRNAGDRNEGRKRSGGSTRAGFDDEDYEARKGSRSKQMKKQEESSTLEKLSSWYEDGEQENKRDGERRQSNAKLSEHHSSSSQNRTKGKDDRSNDRNRDRDSSCLEKRETDQDKDLRSSELRRGHSRRDYTDVMKKAEEGNLVENSDLRRDIKYETGGERSMPMTIEPKDSKSRGIDSTGERGVKSHDNRAERIDFEGRIRGKPEAPEEGVGGSSSILEERSSKERGVEKRIVQSGSPNQDAHETRGRSYGAYEDSAWLRDRNRRDLDRSVSNRSRSPDSERRHHEIEIVETEYERGSISKRKESEKEGYRGDRSRGRDDSWIDNDHEGLKSSWRRRQLSGGNNDKETKEREDMGSYDHDREWEVRRRGREHERSQGRSGGRKDMAVKTSSMYGISNENYDVIEIPTKPFDYNRDESNPTFARRSEPPLPSETKLGPNDEWTHAQDRPRKADAVGAGLSRDDLGDRYVDDVPPARNQSSWREENDSQEGKSNGQRVTVANRNAGVQSPFSGSQTYGNQESGSFGRVAPQGAKGSRSGRGGRGRPVGRDSQQPFGLPLPMMGSPFGPIGMPPPGPMQPLNPSMSLAPPGPISPGIFMPQFPPPVVWPGARGIELNMLAVPPGLSPLPSGSSGPRFPSNLGNPPNSAMFFNQPGLGRGEPQNISSSSGVNAMVPVGRGQTQDKSSGYGFPSRTSGPPGKAPSRGEQNDYSQNFVDTGMRPQNFIRELELTAVVEDYPKLRELIQKKDEIVANSSTAPMYCKCDLHEHVLSPEFFGTKFDVILVDPPWEEYVHRAPGVTDHMEYWTIEEIMNLKIEAIADTPSFIFLWVGDGVGLEQGRQCLKKWGFRRCEDICWVKTNKTNATPGLRHDSHTLFQRSKEHCLMGIKGTVRRSTDGHIIHANIDTDVIIAEEPPYGSTAKPEDMYRIIEHFSLGRRRLELFGEDHNIRAGWVTVGKGLSSSNFNAEGYVKNFADKDGKVWQGGGGRNPPPEAPHLVLTTPDIEALRPKSPMKNQQQLQQQQSASISVTTVNNNSTTSRMQTGNSPNSRAFNQETASASNFPTPAGPWTAMEAFKGSGNIIGNDDRIFDMYGGYNINGGQVNEDYRDFETHRGMNLL